MPHGKICYIEIPATTGEQSAAFYGSIFGWKVRERGDGQIAFDDPGGVSGTWVGERDRTPDEQMLVYIMVDDISATLEQISAAGGRVIAPRKSIGPKGGGFFAVFADPAGTVFGLYEGPG